jgi:hypothetical protein
MSDQIETRIEYIKGWAPYQTDYAKIYIGEYQFNVQFKGGSLRRYERGWNIERNPNLPSKGTGLFLKINVALKEITEKFIKEVQPNTLVINGIDPKRNEWNQKEYRAYEANGYTFCVIRDESYERRATENGITGVAWFRNSYPHPNNYEDPDASFVKNKRSSFWSSFGF